MFGKIEIMERQEEEQKRQQLATIFLLSHYPPFAFHLTYQLFSVIGCPLPYRFFKDGAYHNTVALICIN